MLPMSDSSMKTATILSVTIDYDGIPPRPRILCKRLTLRSISRLVR
jgi:hypothetical protein